ncbi:hypothetical protein SAMN05444583_107217 [Rhodococcus maanshanensis]|uniref:Uncharacterized protein n=1 Tax=Rhodococcus maanshanensis TaxID=183556 RepID=A0A1H7P200_9NOCA|nr:hypothetical protein SAMN05444583_107217 [Rhodococcus maanshanensis]
MLSALAAVAAITLPPTPTRSRAGMNQYFDQLFS